MILSMGEKVLRYNMVSIFLKLTVKLGSFPIKQRQQRTNSNYMAKEQSCRRSFRLDSLSENDLEIAENFEIIELKQIDELNLSHRKCQRTDLSTLQIFEHRA